MYTDVSDAEMGYDIQNKKIICTNIPVIFKDSCRECGKETNHKSLLGGSLIRGIHMVTEWETIKVCLSCGYRTYRRR